MGERYMRVKNATNVMISTNQNGNMNKHAME